MENEEHQADQITLLALLKFCTTLSFLVSMDTVHRQMV